MGNLCAVLSVALLSLAACGDDGGSAKPDATIIHLDAAIDMAPDTPPLPDAPSYDFSCLNNTAPTTANANVTISGTTQEVAIQSMMPTIQANPNVAVKACKGNCMGPNSLGMVTSNAQGMFSTSMLATGGAPLDGYIDATKTGDRRTLVYPPSPLTMDQGMVPVLMFDNQAFAVLNQFLPTPQNDAQNGIIGIIVTDCQNTPITSGAVVTAKQNATAAGDAPFDIGTLAPQGAGTWLITNVPPGITEVNATVSNMTFRAHSVTSVVGATVTTGVRPGY
ncbi:MAG: hypothetical protein H0T46_19950 [Deltaproteobacteria bacterium]|nr:hypothetical protein [Deltaproteobacteria bacterium]